MNKIVVTLLFLLLSRAFSQISGTILDNNTLKPIANVNVFSKVSGTVSKADGTFNLMVSEGSELTFAHIGYMEKRLLAKNIMTVYLNKDVVNLDEIVVESGLVSRSYLNSNNSLTVIRLDEIRESGADHLEDMINRVSNLNWAGGTSRPRYFQLRGVGERSQYFGEGPPNFSIGYVLDDIDLSGLGMVGQLIDINQIEVFKGPQSSVFGSNAIGGVISLRSGKPDEKNAFRYSLSFGDDQKKGVSGLINYKVFDNLFARVSTSYNYSNGFRNNQFLDLEDSNKKDELFARAKILFRPTKDFNILGTVIMSQQKNGYDAWAPDNNNTFITYSDNLGEDSQRTNAGSLRLNYEFRNNLSLKAISSYSKIHQVHNYDGDWANDEFWLLKHGFDPNIEGWRYSFYDSNTRKRNNFSQEIRLSNENYIVGFFYNKLKETDDAMGYLFGGLADQADSKYEFQKLAAYFQSFYKIADKIKLDLSFRLEDYIYKYNGNSTDNYYYTSIPIVTVDQSKIGRDPMLGHKVSISYKRNHFTNLFISYARGYKAGGANQQPFLDIINRSFDPEYIDNFEIGLKTIRDLYALSITGFYGFRRDQQVSVSSQQDLGNPNSFYFFTGNSGKGILRGIEAELDYKVSNSLFTNSSIGFLDTHVEQFFYQTSMGPSYGGNRESAMAPRLTGSLELKYGKEKTYLSLNTSYKSSYYFSDSHDNKSEAYFLSDFTVGHNFRNINLKFWTKNIFNKKFVTRGFYFGLIPPNYPEELWLSYGNPRHFGVTIEYSIN